MLVEKVIGNINDEQFKNSNIDYVDIEWHEAFKKLHRKTSQSGIAVSYTHLRAHEDPKTSRMPSSA